MKENINIDDFLLGKNIQTLRNQKGWSVDILSKKLGKTPSTIRTYESGNASPTLKTLVKIINTFDINAHQLIFEDIESLDDVENKEQSKDQIIKAQRETIEAYKKLITALERQLNEKEL